ncbi:MAG: methyltransferase domain-containing protein [Anaerolineae bacterium]|nr:methyltransferase domain-containing protein [Anaerolineae bacterium]
MSKPRKPGLSKKPYTRSRAEKFETHRYEAVVAEGLEDIGRQELAVHLEKRVILHRTPRTGAEPGVFSFDFTGGLRALLRMRTIQAIYLIRHYAIPRPRALLGDAHFRQFMNDIGFIRGIHPPEAFQTFHINAAGEESSVMRRLRDEVAHHTGLTPDMEEGDLLIRLRKAPQGPEGWETLLRISPRPLTTRPWRVCNMEGALNATVAHTMALMTDPQPYDVFVNLACGSGTLLIERLACGPVKQAIGCDTSPEVLDCARENIAAAGLTDQIALHDWDVTALPLEDGSVDALCADLPFGHLVGSHDENVALYPAVLAEAGRVAKPGALFALITHEVKLMEQLLADSPVWQAENVQRVGLGGLYPRIFVLQRKE